LVQAKAELAADPFDNGRAADAQRFYESLGFKPQREFWSIVSGA